MQTSALYRCVRGKKAKDGIVPYFLPSAEAPLAAIETAEKELANLEKGYEEFCQAMGEFGSIRELADALRREKLKISNTAREARLTYERELKIHNEISPDQVAELEVVKAANMQAGRAQTECSPNVEDLTKRLAKAKAILESGG
jgi:hypothetical protein